MLNVQNTITRLIILINLCFILLLSCNTNDEIFNEEAMNFSAEGIIHNNENAYSTFVDLKYDFSHCIDLDKIKLTPEEISENSFSLTYEEGEFYYKSSFKDVELSNQKNMVLRSLINRSSYY